MQLSFSYGKKEDSQTYLKKPSFHMQKSIKYKNIVTAIFIFLTADRMLGKYCPEYIREKHPHDTALYSSV